MSNGDLHVFTCSWLFRGEDIDERKCPLISGTTSLPMLIPLSLLDRAIVPALHRRYVANMVGMFSDCTIHGFGTLDKAHQEVSGI